MFGLFVIFMALLIAILGYMVTPDSTPLANDQVLQITNKPPGFEVTMLKKRKNKQFEPTGFFEQMWSGKENEYELIPIVGHEFKGDTLIYKEFRGSADLYEEKELALLDIAFALTSDQPSNTGSDGYLLYKTYEGNEERISIDELQAKITAEHFEQHSYLLGTDKFGRDMLSRLIIGVRVSLSVGIVAVFISMIIGIFIGMISGFYFAHPPVLTLWNIISIPLHFMGAVSLIFMVTGGEAWLAWLPPTIKWFGIGLLLNVFSIFVKHPRFTFRIDDVVVWFINTVWSIPTLLLVFAITLALGNNFWQIYVAVGLTMWVEVARIVRGQVVSEREAQYVEAAAGLGFSTKRTMMFHILPNILGPLFVIAAANFAAAILIEAGLSFLGIGVQPPMPSWGSMLSENYGYIIGNKPFLALVPGIAIMLMVLAFNLIGNGIRDALDVKTSLDGN